MLVQILGLLALFSFAIAATLALYVWLIVREVTNPPRGGMAFALARRLPTTPEEMGFATRSFTVACGAEGPASRTAPLLMPVWEVSRDPTVAQDNASSTPRPRIVLLHGWGRTRIDSLSRLEPLLIGNAAAYLPDLRGHGDAAGDRRSRTTLGTHEARDIDQLIATLPPGPVILVGHSLGATIAMQVASQGFERQRIAGVIAIAPYDTLATAIGCRLAARDLPRGIALRLAMALLRLRGIDPPSTLDAARAVSAPLLVLHGARDRMAPAIDAKAIAEAGRGEYVEMPDVEHADHHLRHPAIFERTVRDLLRRALG